MFIRVLAHGSRSWWIKSKNRGQSSTGLEVSTRGGVFHWDNDEQERYEHCKILYARARDEVFLFNSFDGNKCHGVGSKLSPAKVFIRVAKSSTCLTQFVSESEYQRNNEINNQCFYFYLVKEEDSTEREGGYQNEKR